MKNSDNAVEIINISKKYIVHHEKPTLMETLLNGKNSNFMAINNISLIVKKGERLGVIGPNGSGKTTLLKLITGIANPTKGTIKTDGKIVSLIDLEAGFHPDLTGLQNISLCGMLIGMTKDEVRRKMRSIISLAGIGQFIDSQLFTYSQGMKLRLGFATAINSGPDILILDENISVGDEEFAKTSYTKIETLLKQHKTVIIASHNLNFIKKLCRRVIWIENGLIKMDGPAKKVIFKYYKAYQKK